MSKVLFHSAQAFDLYVCLILHLQNSTKKTSLKIPNFKKSKRCVSIFNKNNN